MRWAMAANGVHADRDEKRAELRVIVPLQPDGSAVVF
jgi:hypothetical protein